MGCLRIVSLHQNPSASLAVLLFCPLALSSRPPRRKRRLLNGDASAVSAQLPQNRRRHDGYESARLVAGGRVGFSWYTYQTSLLPPPPSHARSQQSRVAAVHYSKRGLSAP